MSKKKPQPVVEPVVEKFPAQATVYIFADARLRLRYSSHYRYVAVVEGKLFCECESTYREPQFDGRLLEIAHNIKEQLKIVFAAPVWDDTHALTGVIEVVHGFPPKDILEEAEKKFSAKMHRPKNNDEIINELKAVVERESASRHPQAYDMLNDIERAARALKMLMEPCRGFGFGPYGGPPAWVKHSRPWEQY